MKKEKGIRAVHPDVIVLALMAVVVWVSEFWHFLDFGFYADDLTRIPRAMGWTWQQFLSVAAERFATFGGQGRPIQHTLIDFFAMITGKLGDYHVLYIFGFIVLVLNGYLFYKFLIRVGSSSIAILGTFGFILFSADTTQPFVTHSLSLYPAITFFLIAAILYLDKHRLLSYLAICGTLLTYETMFLPFLLLPLFEMRWAKQKLSEMIRHILILMAMIAVSFALRSQVGESRVIGLGLTEMIKTPILHSVQGPAVSMGTYVYRPLQTMQNLNLEVGIFILVFSGLFFVFFSRSGLLSQADMLSVQGLYASWKQTRRFTPAQKRFLWLLGLGLGLLILAYPFTFTIRAFAISGRDTRVHLAAVVGAATLSGCFLTLFLGSFRRARYQLAARLVVGIYLAVMVGYGLVVQRDYVNSWSYQQEFWHQVVDLCPDAGQDDVILVEPSGLRYTRQIDANTWNVSRVLDQLYQFPQEWTWQNLPTVFRLSDNWQTTLILDENTIQLTAASTMAPPSLYHHVPAEHVILLFSDNGQLTRVEQVEIEGQMYQFKQKSADVLVDFPHGILYPIMLGD